MSDTNTPVDAPGMNVPVPRSAKVRKAAQASAPATVKKKRKRQQHTPTKILAREKERKALELRKAGATFHQIATSMQYTDASAAHKAVKRAMGRITQEPAVELKTMQIERLNHALMVLWPQVNAGNTTAINTMLNVMSKLDDIVGTHAASQVDVNVQHSGAVMVIDGNEEDFVQGLKRMAGMVDPSTGQNHGAQALPSTAPQVMYPPGMGPAITPAHGEDEDIVDAVLVEEEDVDPTLGTSLDRDPAKPKFNFGVDPKRQA